jgi:hypothetical protein
MRCAIHGAETDFQQGNADFRAVCLLIGGVVIPAAASIGIGNLTGGSSVVSANDNGDAIP